MFHAPSQQPAPWLDALDPEPSPPSVRTPTGLCHRSRDIAWRLLHQHCGEGEPCLPPRAVRRLWRHLAAPALPQAAPELGHLALDAETALALLRAVREQIEATYGFAVRERELPAPWTGTFDGEEIALLEGLPNYLKSFILLHLFGHSVQWTAPSLAGALGPLQTETDQEKFLAALSEYEYGAARFGMRLLQELGLDQGLKQWFADFVETDRRYVEDWYRRGKGASPRPLADFLAHDQPSVEPADIPPLELRKVQLRFAF